MSNIVCDFNGAFYDVRIEYIGEVYCKVDTGAGCTIMGLDLFHALMGGNKHKILEFITNSDAPRQTFKTYSGNKFDAVLCRLRNVKLAGVLLSEFYFYVTTAPVNSYGLIGMDFIRCCKLEGHPNQALILRKMIDNKLDDNNFVELDQLSMKESSEFDSAMDIMSGK